MSSAIAAATSPESVPARTDRRGLGPLSAHALLRGRRRPRRFVILGSSCR